MDIEEVWSWVGIILVLAAASLGLKVVTADKHVDSYYLSQGNGQNNVICVYTHWVWHPDERAFCTDRYQDAIDFQTKANETLNKK